MIVAKSASTTYLEFTQLAAFHVTVMFKEQLGILDSVTFGMGLVRASH